MVFLSIILNSTKRLPRKHLRSGFRDSLRIYVHGGHGGSGLPKYGGLGGRGGNVYVVATEKLSLGHVAKQVEKLKCKARPGMDSSAKGIIGKPGEDLELSVPCGVTVFKDKVLLGEVNEPGSKLLVARGGLGGCPETGYCGEKGESHAINLDLKLIADVGLVGFPNAGKSTLLKAISNASPKIANYPFTTIRPQLGTIQYDDHRKITVADLPGLIEGAHMNFGMGHQFLKHLDRTKLLLFVVDIQGFQLSRKYVYRNCLETVVLLNKEIELYKPDLLNMPAMLVVNKMDTKDAHGLYEDIKEKLNNLQDIVPDYPEEMQPEKVLQFSKILTMSLISKNREEIDNLKMNIRSILDKYEEEKQIALQETSLEEKLYERLALETKQHTPSLI